MKEWRDRAACIGVDSDIFFPTATKFSERTWKHARKICATCIVQNQCLQFALSVDVSEDRWGMYGGMTPTERRAHRRKIEAKSERLWR